MNPRNIQHSTFNVEHRIDARRITNVEPLPDEVLDRIYSKLDEEDEKEVRRFMAVQALGGDD